MRGPAVKARCWIPRRLEADTRGLWATREQEQMRASLVSQVLQPEARERRTSSIWSGGSVALNLLT